MYRLRIDRQKLEREQGFVINVRDNKFSTNDLDTYGEYLERGEEGRLDFIHDYLGDFFRDRVSRYFFHNLRHAMSNNQKNMSYPETIASLLEAIKKDLNETGKALDDHPYDKKSLLYDPPGGYHDASD
jgi:hypothetical protein